MLPFVEPKYIGLLERQKRVLDIAARFSESFLRFIPRKINNYPSHGIDHTLNIIQLTNKFLEHWQIKLSRDEKFLLYLAAWLHDIGCITTRKRHNRKSVQLLVDNESLCNFLNDMDNELLLNLSDIIRSHSKSSFNIQRIQKKRGKIRTQLICSIFRLMDACEIARFKCPRAVYNEIKSTFKKRGGGPDEIAIAFWEGHMNISEVEFHKPNILIHMRNQRQSQTIISSLSQEIESIQDIFNVNGIPVPKILRKSL